MKKIMSFLIAILMATFAGQLFADVLDVSPFIAVPAVFAMSLIPTPKGVLMFNFANVLWEEDTENMGGIRTIGYFAPISEVDNFPALPANPSTADEEVTLEASPGFTFLDSKYFREIYSTQETAEVVDEPQGEVDGQSFVHKATIFHPGTKKEVMAFAKQVNNANMVFILLEADGKRRVIGSEAFPAKCKPSITTGKATADRKGMTLEITSYGYTPAPFYDGVIRLNGSAIS